MYSFNCISNTLLAYAVEKIVNFWWQ